MPAPEAEGDPMHAAHDLAHRSDPELLRDLERLVTRDRSTTAALLAHLAEVDARRLYLAQGHPSMFAYCVEALRYSEDAACKRIQAARAARRFPVLLAALADGRLHLTAVGLLAPHLTPANVDELVAAATRARKAAVEQFLSRRFPRMEALLAGRPAVRPVRPVPPATVPQLAPAQVVESTPWTTVNGVDAGVDATGDTAGEEQAPAGDPNPAVPPTVEPAPAQVAAQHVLRVVIGQETRDKLDRARALLRHSLPSGDVGAVLDRALDALIAQCEKRKFAAVSKPRPTSRPTLSKRHVPAAVRRVVWERDEGRCAFVGKDGRRCAARDFLEFDHAVPLARGGRTTADRMRLLCRAHNQHEAERLLGASFMHEKRRGGASRTASTRSP
jgi:5-methylcytosine-specific restriction endonuclease McrA